MTDSLKFKRFLAYFIDLFIVSVLVTLLSRVNFLNPMRSKYQKAVKEYTTYVENVQEKLKSNDKVDTKTLITKEYITDIYNIDYYGVSYIIIDFVVFICYFTFLPFFNNGQTFGKEFMKIKVVNEDDSDIKFGKCFLRSLVIPIFSSIFVYTSLRGTLLAILVFLLKPKSYFYANSILIGLFTIYGYIDIISVIISKNDLSFHDRFLRTKVINYVRTK